MDVIVLRWIGTAWLVCAVIVLVWALVMMGEGARRAHMDRWSE